MINLINHKGASKAKDGEDWRGLQTANLKNLGLTFLRCAERDVAPLSKKNRFVATEDFAGILSSLFHRS